MGSCPVAHRFYSLLLIASIAASFPIVIASSSSVAFAGSTDIHRLAIKKKKKKEPPARDDNQLSEKGRPLIPFAFPLPESLKPNFEFWKRIYSEFDINHAVIHDTEHLQVIYSVLDFSNPGEGDLPKGARIRAEKERIRTILERLADGVTEENDLSDEERVVYNLFKTVDEPDKFKAAAEPGRIRSQTGQKDKFIRAIEWSGSYLTEIENIFVSYGIPTDLTRLIFVESMFNPKARSRVGASGLWQFMPGTGRLFMTVNAVMDERNDPYAATHAAAKLLKTNYERLGQWPLAVNAYNSGALNLAQAMEDMQTDDIGLIAKNYRGGSYKFASRNFYTEFLAALEVANHYKDYFGEIARMEPVPYETFTLETPLLLSQLTERCGVDMATLEEMNPAYSKAFFSNSKPFPAGRTLRIPAGFSDRFAEAVRNISEEKAIAAQ